MNTPTAKPPTTTGTGTPVRVREGASLPEADHGPHRADGS